MYPCKPQFFYIKVGFKGVIIARTCFPDVLKKDFYDGAKIFIHSKAINTDNFKLKYEKFLQSHSVLSVIYVNVLMKFEFRHIFLINL